MTNEEEALGLPPYKRWYRYGFGSPGVLFARLRNRYMPLFRLRMAWQRATRGYGDDDLWNLNFAVAKLIVAGCRSMREVGHGYPAEFSPEYGDGKGWTEWEAILVKIETGFQAWLDEDGYFFETPEKEAQYKEAMDLFSHWFGALWD